MVSIRLCLKIPGLTAAFQEHLDLPEVYNEESLDDTTVYCLWDAASNIEIAKYFLEDRNFMLGIEELHTNPRTDKSIQKALKKLLSRLRGWQAFEDALTNPRGDFASSIAFLKDITTTEHSIGCWLECMMTNGALANKLGEVLQNRSLPFPLFQEQQATPSHEEFLTFVRTLFGVSTVLPVLAWADSVGNSPCRERALAVLVLWQGIDGYREVTCPLSYFFSGFLNWVYIDCQPLPTLTPDY